MAQKWWSQDWNFILFGDVDDCDGEGNDGEVMMIMS